MSSAVAALVGAGLGASATLVVSILNARFQAKRDATAWERDSRRDAYYSATRPLLRVRNRRRRMAEADPRYAEIPKEELSKFLDDLDEAQHGLSMLAVVCGEGQRERLDAAIKRFDKLADEMRKKPPPALDRLRSLAAEIDEVWNVVLAAESHDVSTSSR